MAVPVRAEPPPEPAAASATPSSSSPSPSPSPSIDQLDRLALESDVTPAHYLMGPGDKLRMDLWGLQELTQELEVNAEGKLFVPRAGVFDATGKTLAALRDAVEKRLKSLYPREQSSLTLTRPRSFLVHVTGAVARPGTYPASPLMRLSALLPRAGGALPSGSLRRVEIRRRGQTQPVIADLIKFTLLGEVDANPLLLDGDTVFVPARGVTVEINGAVRRPGSYELVATRTLQELLDLAGGRASSASRELPVRVSTRGNGDHVLERSVDLRNAAQIVLNDGDVVHVPQLADLSRTVSVEGAVVGMPAGNEPGRAPVRPGETIDQPARETSVSLPYVEGDGTRDLVAKAGGLQPWADARNAYISRTEKDGTRRHIPVDLPAINTGAVDDVRITPGDALIVPTRREQVMIGGAVQHPGLFQYSSDLRPRDYINLAGGPTRSGNPEAARVLSVNGGSQPISKVSTLQPGDVITVPERKFTTAEITEVVLIAGNIVVSSIALTFAALANR